MITNSVIPHLNCGYITLTLALVEKYINNELELICLEEKAFFLILKNAAVWGSFKAKCIA